MFKMSNILFFCSMVPWHCVYWSVLFSKCWGAFLRAPCRALKPPKIDSPCKFVQKWLFDDSVFCKLLKSCLSRVRTSKNENKSRGVTMLLGTGGQELPTPIYTSIPSPHKHTPVVSKTLQFLFLDYHFGPTDQQMDRQSLLLSCVSAT